VLSVTLGNLPQTKPTKYQIKHKYNICHIKTVVNKISQKETKTNVFIKITKNKKNIILYIVKMVLTLCVAMAIVLQNIGRNIEMSNKRDNKG